MIGWVFFRAETLPGAIAFLSAMAGLGPAIPAPLTVGGVLSTPTSWLALAAGSIGSTPWVPALAARAARKRRDQAIGMEVIATARRHSGPARRRSCSIAARTYNPFIYFRF